MDDDSISSPKAVNDFDVGIGHQEVLDEIRCEIITGVNANSDALPLHRPFTSLELTASHPSKGVVCILAHHLCQWLKSVT
ncbi:MAG: hypothetical protein OGMRLDGQ_003223 [Candidatus Fervidibacter sp.]